jgi:hypothetical protein
LDTHAAIYFNELKKKIINDKVKETTVQRSFRKEGKT